MHVFRERTLKQLQFKDVQNEDLAEISVQVLFLCSFYCISLCIHVCMSLNYSLNTRYMCNHMEIPSCGFSLDYTGQRM